MYKMHFEKTNFFKAWRGELGGGGGDGRGGGEGVGDPVVC